VEPRVGYVRVESDAVGWSESGYRNERVERNGAGASLISYRWNDLDQAGRSCQQSRYEGLVGVWI
jgi:hypothetical protein